MMKVRIVFEPIELFSDLYYETCVDDKDAVILYDVNHYSLLPYIEKELHYMPQVNTNFQLSLKELNDLENAYIESYFCLYIKDLDIGADDYSLITQNKDTNKTLYEGYFRKTDGLHFTPHTLVENIAYVGELDVVYVSLSEWGKNEEHEAKIKRWDVYKPSKKHINEVKQTLKKNGFEYDFLDDICTD